MQLRDSFNRPDSAVSLGTADVGGTWVQQNTDGAAVLGILSDEAFVAVSPAVIFDTVIATLDAGVADHFAEATIDIGSSVPSDADFGLVLRAGAPNVDCILIIVQRLPFFASTFIAVSTRTVVAGVSTDQFVYAFESPNDAFRIRGQVRGNRLSIFVDGHLIISEKTSLMTGNDCGLLANFNAGGNVDARWDDFVGGPVPSPRTGPCDVWTDAALIEGCGLDLTGVPVSEIQAAIRMATDVLYFLSGRKYAGICEETVRPCARAVFDPGANVRFRVGAELLSGVAGTSSFFGGALPFLACNCQTGRSCGCCTLDEIALISPIVGITEVRENGVVLTAGVNYRVDDTRFLVRIDGQGWPCCQDLRADPFEALPESENTWVVTYQYGLLPPAGGVRSATLLATELIKSCLDQDCQLPKRVTQVTRQGVTAVILDPFDFLDTGSTGIFEVDLWLKSVNPGGVRQRTRIVSPDIKRRGRYTNTAP